LPRRAVPQGHAMTFDYLLGGLAVVFMLVYLIYALVKPEKF
jgi:K+-transporting ATPase KdpF subunit